MPENKYITVWERYNTKSNQWEFNHISDGYFKNQKQPIPKSEIQKKSWPNARWRKFKAYLKGISVVLDTAITSAVYNDP